MIEIRIIGDFDCLNIRKSRPPFCLSTFITSRRIDKINMENVIFSCI
jgi:hypothetical protein